MVIPKIYQDWVGTILKLMIILKKWVPEYYVRYVSIMESVDPFSDCVSNDIAPILIGRTTILLNKLQIKWQFEYLRKKRRWTNGEIHNQDSTIYLENVKIINSHARNL